MNQILNQGEKQQLKTGPTLVLIQPLNFSGFLTVFCGDGVICISETHFPCPKAFPLGYDSFADGQGGLNAIFQWCPRFEEVVLQICLAI